MLFIDYASKNDLIAWSVWIIYFATAKIRIPQARFFNN